VRAVAAVFALLFAGLAFAGTSAHAVEPPLARADYSPSAEAVKVKVKAKGATDADRACLTEAIYFEAQPSAEAQRAVAHVILNRAQDKRFPKTVCGVVKDGCQFSYRCSGRSLALKDKEKRVKAARAAEAVLAGASDPTNGALFFHSARIKPGWKHKKTGVIGGNVFYR
jgi:N-acetylmuramoyl-L-alanine amidase